MKYPDIRLGDVEAVWNILGGQKGVDALKRGELVVSEQEKSKLLEFITTTQIPACEQFVARDEFRDDRSDIRLWMSDDFQENFLENIEEKIEPATLLFQRLLKDSKDLPIITELGGGEETTIYHLHTLLMKQRGGEDGVLLTNGLTNIFYIRDKKGLLWAVRAYWLGDAWDLHASSVGFPYVWGAGGLVVSYEVPQDLVQ